MRRPGRTRATGRPTCPIVQSTTGRRPARFTAGCAAPIEAVPPANSAVGEFGLVVGRDGSSWTGFLVRRGGSAAILRRSAAGDQILSPWAANDSIPQPASAPARAIIRVEAERDSVHFRVNGAGVGSVLRSAVPVDGVFGLRVGRGVNVHVSRLDHTRRLAPSQGR